MKETAYRYKIIVGWDLNQECLKILFDSRPFTTRLRTLQSGSVEIRLVWLRLCMARL